MVVGFIPDTLGVAVLTSTILAGLRRSTGQTVKVSAVRNALGQQALGIYLGVGEWVFERLANYAKSSKYFAYDANATLEWAKKQPSEFVRGIQQNIGDLAAEITGMGHGAGGHGDVRQREVRQVVEEE